MNSISTNWPPIFATVSEWTECPDSASLEERAAWTVLEVRDLNRGDFSPEDASLAADAEVVLRELRAVAPKVEADAGEQITIEWVEARGFSSRADMHWHNPTVGLTLCPLADEICGPTDWDCVELPLTFRTRGPLYSLLEVLQEADDAKSN